MDYVSGTKSLNTVVLSWRLGLVERRGGYEVVVQRLHLSDDSVEGLLKNTRWVELFADSFDLDKTSVFVSLEKLLHVDHAVVLARD